MGCGSSQPLDQPADQEAAQLKQAPLEGGKQQPASTPAPPPPQEPQQAQTETQDDDGAGPDAGAQERAAKKANVRARRLSYVTADANGKATADASGPVAKPVTPPGGLPPSASTRARRLSYIDPNHLSAKLGGQDPSMLDGDMPGAELGSMPGTVMPADGSDQDDRTLKVLVACMSRAGREPGFKKTNQDNCFAFEKYITEDQSLFGAMDGHGPHGHLVSGFVKQHLPIILVNHLTTDRDVCNALTSGFVEVDRSLGNSRIDCEFSGSTAVVSYLKGRTLTTAWVGDSRGVMGRYTEQGGWEAIDLTNDHKPTTPEEKTRILKSNGRVERLVDEVGQPMGPYRVWLQYAWIPGLAMSRALGDVLAHQVGVISEPEHSVMELCPDDQFIVLASDGVWEFISSQQAVDIVAKCETAEEACRQLVDEAYQRWLEEEEGVVDDITAVVVRFVHPENA